MNNTILYLKEIIERRKCIKNILLKCAEDDLHKFITDIIFNDFIVVPDIKSHNYKLTIHLADRGIDFFDEIYQDVIKDYIIKKD